MDSCQPPAHPGWPSMGSPRRVRRCPWTCSDTARNPPCISSLVTETSGVTSVMSTIVGATAGWGSHMLAVYYMLTGLLRCWHVRSSHVASGVTVTWLVRTDGFFATSRDTTSLDPGDQSSNISSTNIVLQRTILYNRRISLSWPAHRGTCIARSMAMGHAMSVAKSSVRWLTSTKTNFREYRKFQKWIDFGWCYNFIEMPIYDLLINSCCAVMSRYFYFF